MDASSDELDDLRKKLIQGDKNALATLFDLHRDRLWRIVQFRMEPRMMGRLDPDDVLQDAFVDAAKRIHHFSKEKQFSPFVWLRLIVGQTLTDAHRKHMQAKQRDASRETPRPKDNFPNATSISLADFLSARISTPSQTLGKTEQNAKLHQAIEQMEPIDQEILAMRHFEELSNKEISEVLGIEQKAASVRYIRAISRLKKILGSIPEFADQFFSLPTDGTSKPI